MDCKSALAEAEVEYQDKDSLSVDVAFRVIDNEEFIDRSGLGDLKPEIKTIIPIWTTTPWTLPSNEAVVLGGDIDYSIFETTLHNERVICLLATELIETNLKRWGIELIGKPNKIDPSVLEGLMLEHPIYKKEVPILIGDYVTTENGTGAVHTAPAHGQDDFEIGKKHKLDLECYVNSYGIFDQEKEFFSGQHIFKSEPTILEKIEERNNLIHQEGFVHSYPHCWRHKSPLIFRTTRQWFISMDNKSFRENCLKAIGEVKWFP